MNEYLVGKDCLTIRKILGLSQTQLAEAIGVSFSSINRMENGKTCQSPATIESLYSFAFSNRQHPIRLNKLKTQFHLETHNNILFHGSRDGLIGKKSPNISERKIDFGHGLCCEESLDQAESFVCSRPKGSIYIISDEGGSDLKTISFDATEEWMLLVTYYRGELEKYKNSPKIVQLVQRVENADIIIAPIADNTMYTTMDQFASGALTDIQAEHALAASSLGKQHIYKTAKACAGLKILERLYVCKEEKEEFLSLRSKNADIARDKVLLSKEKYRREGKYIDELFG